MWPFGLSIVGFIGFAASQPMTARLMEEIVNSLEAGDSANRYLLPLTAIVIFLFRGVSSFVGEYFNAYVGESVVRKIKLDLFEHLTVLPASFYDNQTQGMILHRLNSGAKKVKASITTALKTLIREGLTVIALLSYAFYLNWKLSLTFLLVAPILAVMVSYTAKQLKKIIRRNEGALGKAMQISKEMVGNYGVVRGFGAEQYEMARYQKMIDKSYKAHLQIRRLSAIFAPVSQVLVSIALAGIIFMLLDPETLAKNNAGELVGYLIAIGLIPKPLVALSGVSVVIQRGLIGAELIFALLDQKPEQDDGSYAPDKVATNIEVKNLSFNYPSTGIAVLKDISFSVSEGEVVAIVGPSGSGKSTIVNLLCRHYVVDDGKIFLDGVDLNEYKLSNLRQHISMVNQNIGMFDDTIRNNIAYGETYTEEEILAALKHAHAYDFVMNLPDSLDTKVGDNALRLSGGQRQRLTIARAFLKNASLLILDEATSSLDNESENIVNSAIEKLFKSRTTIVIAHRLSTILKADRLLVLENGEIVETGTHAELLAYGGYYTNLINSEFKKKA